MATTKVSRIGKYEVLDVLGKGGMGVVYKATDPAIGRLVAIKVITSGFAEDPAFLRRFYREAQSTGKLQHQNIVIVHELGDQDGTPFLVMEYLEGESLQALINARAPLPLIDKLGLVMQACNGLHYAHQRNIVHRDIKPGNLMVLKDGVLKIVDFGIARIETENVTVPGQVMGSIQYMSPEQINGISVDCRTDIFSLGVVLYQILTYTLPFQGKDTGSTLLKIINEPPPPLQNFLDVFPADLEPVLHRALAKSRDQRYPTAEDFAFDLSQVQEQLKRELVSEYLTVAEDLIARGELSRAKEQVYQILRVDRQNRRANEMLREVQRLIQQQQRSEQARQLQAQAEEAIARNELERALAYLDEAVTLAPESAELKRLRDETRTAKERQQKMKEAIHRAESAQWAGDLTEAMAAAEEAIGIDANDLEAKALHEAIRNEINERRRQQQIQDLLGEAQRQISSRRFTAAIEALRKAEELDPAAPAVKDLMALAASGQEQERRRKEIEQLTTEIQDAINRDDYRLACEKANAAVQKFPNERALLKLQTLAEKQRQAGEKRHFVEEQISKARKLLEASQTAQALAVLEAACKRFPTEAALLSLLTVVRENLEQERLDARKNEYIQRAKEAMRTRDFEEAISVLETAHAELHVPEIEDLLQFAKDEAAAFKKRQAVEAAAHEAHRLLLAEEYEDAIKFLSNLLQELSDEELEILLADAKRQLADFNRRVTEATTIAERLLRAERVIEAVRYLESQTDACGKSAEFCAMLERARSEQERMHAIAGAVQSARTALAKQDFTGALQTIEQCRKSVGDHADLSRMAAEIDAQRREAATKAVAKAVADSRMLLLGRSYDSAVQLLDSVSGVVELADADVREKYETMRGEVTRGLERAQKKEADTRAAASATAEDEGTEEQIEWSAPSTSVASAKSRDRDLQELTQLERESDTNTDIGALEAVSQRARLIAKRYPGDSQVETMATLVVRTADKRARDVVTTRQAPPAPAEPKEKPKRKEETKAPAATPAEKTKPPATVTEKSKPSPEPPRRVEVVAPKPEPVPPPMRPPAVAPAAQETVAMTQVLAPTGVQLGTAIPDTRVEPPPTARPTLVPPPPPKARASRLPFYAGAAVALLAVIGVAAWLLSRGPGKSVVTIQTAPERATVRLRDKSCVTPNCKLALPPGTYDVAVALPGYAPAATSVKVEEGKTAPPVNISLTPLPPSLQISGNFSDAKVSLDGRDIGALKNGQLQLPSITPGNHDLKVAGKDGEAELTFSATPGHAPIPNGPARGRNISVLAVSSLAGSTRVDCNCTTPSKLAVDGKPQGELGQSGRDLGNLGEGVHELQVGTGDEARTASVKLTSTPALDVFLNAERNAGTLLVETGVDDADVFVNNKRYPRTAGGTLRIPLDAKNYTVRVEKQGYQPASPQQVDIRKNQETRVTFNLTPKEQKGFLALRGAVAGARVSIDGNAIGQVDRNGRFRSPSLPAGQHVINLEKDGYEARKIDANIKAGETVNLSGNDVEMAKAAPPAPPTTANNTVTPPSPTPTPAPPVNPPPAIDPAKAEWVRVSNSSDASALQAYVKKYPSSPYTAEANRKLEQLDWNRVRDSNDASALQAFVDAHPNSAFTEQARNRLQQIKTATAAESDRKAILGVLDRYKTAYEHADVNMLTQIWPTLAKQQLKGVQTFFQSARDVRVQLTNTSGPDIKGDKATVRSTQVIDYKLNDKAAKPIEAKVSFELRKKDGVWVLDSVR